MRWDIKIASYFFTAAAFFAVCVMAAPDYLHLTGISSAVCFWSGLIGAVCFTTAGFRAALLGEAFRPQVGHARRMIGLYGMVACAVGFLGFAATYLWMGHNEAKTGGTSEVKTEPQDKPRRPLTMRQVFDSDFPGVGKTMMDQTVTIGGETSHFTATEYWDIPTASYFLAFYFGKDLDPMKLSFAVADSMSAIRNNIGQIEIKVATAANSFSLNNLTMSFSKQIYLYFDRELMISEQAAIQSNYTSHGYDVHIRTDTYRFLHWKEFERDPVGAGPTGLAVRLPKVDAGTTVNIKNRTGSLPTSTTVLGSFPPSPTPP